MDHENNSWCSAQVPLNKWYSERPRKGENKGKGGMTEPHNHEYQTDQKFQGSTITKDIVRSKGRRASREGRTFLYRMSCLPVSGTGGGLRRVTCGSLPRGREAGGGDYLMGYVARAPQDPFGLA